MSNIFDLKAYENKWVAFDKKRAKILASGASVIAVELQLKKKKLNAHQIEFILPLNMHYVPICRP